MENYQQAAVTAHKDQTNTNEAQPLDTIAEDDVQYQPRDYTETSAQEVNGNEKREETREAFVGRAIQASLEIGERGTLAFGYRRYSGQLSQNIRAAEEGLKKLNIPVVVFEQMEGIKTGGSPERLLFLPMMVIFTKLNCGLRELETEETSFMRLIWI